jgi:3-hydroxyacyl-CoA dehydrogenase/enoyl-CoA hydratase/3-hydroxybutyryl-CoA epimerase
MYRQAERTVNARTHGHYPAPLRALDCVRAGQEQGFGAGLAAEAVAFGDLAVSLPARRLIGLFFATEGLKHEQRPLIARVPAITDVGVVGAGFMGAGIAQAAAVGGARVRLRDITADAVARGLKTARSLTMAAARKGRFSRSEAGAIVARLSGTTDYSGFRRPQLVIEAVFEDRDIKRAVVADLEKVLAPEAVIASNTSSLPIASLAEGAGRPERILGMHFFSPVHKMPLLEIVRTEATSEAAIAVALAEGQAMGKTAIVVGDGPGFYTTRVLAFMLQEAGLLFEAGASIDAIDRALTAFGFPTGPLALIDEVGIDVAAHIGEVLRTAFPGRFPQTAALGRMVESGRLGRKSGGGFYDYRGRRKKPDRSVYALRHATAMDLPRSLMQRRMILAFVNEAARCLEEGIIASPRDGDVGAIMGIGFPPFLGGPFRYVDDTGAATVVGWLDQCAYAYGPRFEPARVLRDLAETGARFYGEMQ